MASRALAVAKPRRLQKNEVELLKRTVAKGVTDDEFSLFLWVCKKHKLDPMCRQVHAVRRYVQRHHQDEKGIWIAGHQMVIQIGIDGYRALAGRDHADFGGCDEPEFSFDADKRIPTKATVRLWKKGLEHPIVGVAYWDEYAPRDLAKPEAFMWNKMPKHMLAKCAEALALRKGYPELADIYTNEEMSQTMDEYAPSGRQIVSETNPQTAIDAEVERQKKEHTENVRAREAKAKKEKPIAPVPEQVQADIWPKRDAAK